MIRVNQLKTGIEESQKQLMKRLKELFGCKEKDFTKVEIIRRSIDARKKPEIYYIYTVDVYIEQEEKFLRKLKKHKGMKEQITQIKPQEYHFPPLGETPQTHRTVIVGTGPAGLFCGYYLALQGYCPILLERGKDVDARTRDVEAFWESGSLNTASNVQFGEGGAGTFSDGKLNTLVKDKSGRNHEVLKVFVQHGAPEEILYDAKPHIGTDVLRNVVKSMRETIIRMGGEVRFESRVSDILTEGGKVKGVVINDQEILPCQQLVLAIGHSARDTFFLLQEKEIPMEAKSFAVGLRVEHPQSAINFSQYGREEFKELGAAPYKVTAKTSVNRGVYSFCMCPGGYVVNASSEEGHLAVNGMSYSGRDSGYANSAIIVSVTPQDFGGEGPLAGVLFQRSLEERAYRLGGGNIPAQRFGVFKKCVKRKVSQDKLPVQEVEAACGDGFEPICKGQFTWADVSQILPEECNQAFVEGMEVFGRQIPGFDREDTVLLGVESRTSSPVRILRNEELQSTLVGLYPCGEGAGYAGGITSAAMDGLRVAEKIASAFSPMKPLV